MGTRNLSPGGRIAFGSALALLGVGICAVTIYRLIEQPSLLRSGDVAAAPAGLIFATGGLLILIPESYALSRRVLLALIVTGFALTADWVAFGPGPREFGFSASVGGAGVAGKGSELLGRAVFGIGAIGFDAVAALMWWRLVSKALCRSR